MSYISTQKVGDQVFVWERTPEGRVMKTYAAPYYLYVPDDEGEFKSIYGERLARYDNFKNGKHFNSTRYQLQSQGVRMFESDIPPELKVLSEHYYDVTAPKLNVTFLDIEVDYNRENGFSSIANPYAAINAIAMYHQWKDQYVVFAIPPDDATCEVPAIGQADQSFIDAMHAIAPMEEGVDVDIRFFKNEEDLMKAMCFEFTDSDLLCGWNSDFFDIPYIARRLKMCGGAKMEALLCFSEAKAPTWRKIEKYGQEMEMVDIYGRQRVDYLELFKKYEVAERPSYKLESIADEVLPEMPKLKYEGSLADLYRADFNYFIRYNIRDTEILKGFEDRLGYVALANEMIHLSTAEFKHVGGTLKLAELASINYCHHKLGNIIVNDMDVPEVDGQIQGALVLVPQVGQHRMVGSVDINSLYPSGIRAINISPETIIGQFTLKPMPVTTVTDSSVLCLPITSGATHHVSNSTMTELTLEYDDGRVETRTGAEWNDYLREQKWAISGYGTVFNQNVQGIIPKILEDWYGSRKIYQGNMRGELGEATQLLKIYADDPNIEAMIREVKTAAGEGGFDCASGGDAEVFVANDSDIIAAMTPEDRARYLKHKEAAAYFDRLQYVYKIKLNSFYGALTNKFFRFYDLRMGESTTGTGRTILLHQCAQSAKELDGVYQLPDKKVIRNVKGIDYQHWGYDSEWSVVYGDTDSTYFVTHGDSDETLSHAEQIVLSTKLADLVGKNVNATFPGFMRDTFLCTDGYDQHIQTGREIVSDNGIFVDKKRYILHIVDNEGQKVSKMKVMGLDTKKTTMPKEVANKLNTYIEQYLTGTDWDDVAADIVEYKEQLRNTNDIMTIGLPKGIKGIEKYTEELKILGDGTRLPGHVAAGILYNLCLERFEDKDSLKIISGMKIKVFYLTQKVGRFKSIAIPVDMNEVPQWFHDEFQVDMDAHIERLVDNPLDNIIKAIGKTAPTKQGLYVSSIMEF